jgi:putative molybdenum carrier protein
LPNWEQRTEWNVRDSDATLILIRGSGLVNSSGTKLTLVIAEKLGRNYLLLDLQKRASLHEARSWNEKAGDEITLNIAGPRESEAPGIYEQARIFLRQLLR